MPEAEFACVPYHQNAAPATAAAMLAAVSRAFKCAQQLWLACTPWGDLQLTGAPAPLAGAYCRRPLSLPLEQSSRPHHAPLPRDPQWLCSRQHSQRCPGKISRLQPVSELCSADSASDLSSDPRRHSLVMPCQQQRAVLPFGASPGVSQPPVSPAAVAAESPSGWRRHWGNPAVASAPAWPAHWQLLPPA
jgi:hypothetical protein